VGPTVILARRFKGYGWAKRAKEERHASAEKLNEEKLKEFPFAVWDSAERSGLYRGAVLSAGGRQREIQYLRAKGEA